MLLPALLAACSKPPPPPYVAQQCFTELVTALSSDAFDGRGLGTPGLEQAARLIEERLTAEGLGDAGIGYRQDFRVTTEVALGKANALEDPSGVLVVGTDFTPLALSANGDFAGPLVFAGYGVTAPELGYDDYAGLDVKDKVVLAMRYEPRESDETSPFDGKRASNRSDLRLKASSARDAGAAALILVAPAAGEDDPDRLPSLASASPPSRVGLPVIQITRRVADRWLARSGTDLATLQAAIDAATQPRSMSLPNATVKGRVDVVATEVETRNVLGVLPGEGPLASEFVVVGAHYDHLGHGGAGAADPNAADIYNGADDNASGTAAMVCAMTALARKPPPGPRRSILAIAFSAAELGLGGSRYYVDHPVEPLAQTVAMLDLDMVGRVQDDQILALHADSAAQWGELIQAAATASGLKAVLGGEAYGPSDETPFYQSKIPVTRLFSGTEDQYHTPDDDLARLNLPGGAKVSDLVSSLLGAVATRPGRLVWERSISTSTSGDERSFNAWLGARPDLSASARGVTVQAVTAGSPADRAGVAVGDLVVELGGEKVATVPELAYALQSRKPGDTVAVVVMRDGQLLTLHATLVRRPVLGHAAASAENPTGHVGSFSVGADPAPPGDWVPTAGRSAEEFLQPDEKHLADLRQLTFGGDNAEAYWSPDGRKLMFQRTPGPGTCDQEYQLDLTTGRVTRLSSGAGRTTCGYYSYPDGDKFLYATTEASGPECPPVPDPSHGYTWPLYGSMELVWQKPGEAPVPLAPHPGYDAEGTVCAKDGRIVFTSVRDGDLDLYLMNPDGSHIERLTQLPGYDGGAFFNASCTAIVWRASRPTGQALKDYQKLLKQELVRPTSLEIFWMDLQTRAVEQLTANGAANFGPFPLPDDSGVLFASNLDGGGPEFDLYLVKRPSKEIERVTTAKSFDGFPMFSPDGKWLVFASNRATEAGKRDTNLFVARWVP